MFYYVFAIMMAGFPSWIKMSIGWFNIEWRCKFTIFRWKLLNETSRHAFTFVKTSKDPTADVLKRKIIVWQESVMKINLKQ